MKYSEVYEKQPRAEDQASHRGCSSMIQDKVEGETRHEKAKWQVPVSSPAPPGVNIGETQPGKADGAPGREKGCLATGHIQTCRQEDSSALLFPRVALVIQGLFAVLYKL